MKLPFQLAYTMYMYLNYTVMYSIATLLQMKPKFKSKTSDLNLEYCIHCNMIKKCLKEGTPQHETWL